MLPIQGVETQEFIGQSPADSAVYDPSILGITTVSSMGGFAVVALAIFVVMLINPRRGHR